MSKKRFNLMQLPGALLQWFVDRLAAIDKAPRNYLLKGAGLHLLVVIVLLAIGLGLRRMETFVDSQRCYDHPLVLEWNDLPDWLRLPENGHILDSLVQRIDLRDTDRPLDPRLAARVGSRLLTPEVAWVKSLDHVQVRPDGVVGVKCRFRRPHAWVKSASYCYLLDDELIRLPGRYDAHDCQSTSLMTIIGVRGKLPAVGQRWNASDLAAGLRLVTLLSSKPFRGEISAVSVANHDGRLDKNRPHIELLTTPKGSRIWWGRPPHQEQGIEITAEQKLNLLESLHKRWGRLAVDRPYIDIRTWPDRIAMPIVVPTSTQPRILRG